MEEKWTNARRLRRDMTEAEQCLWYQLRRRALGGFKFRRQYPIAGFITDFACVEARLVVEADGSQQLEASGRDAIRSQRLQEAGYRVLRFWNHEILTDMQVVLEVIHGALATPPRPSPSRKGRELERLDQCRNADEDAGFG